MPELARFRCLNCGKRFEAEVLTQEEQEEYRRRGLRSGNIQCPECRRNSVRRGWD